MAQVVDQHGKVWPSQAAYFAAMERKNPLSEALTTLAQTKPKPKQ